jgi:iron complex outermembrane recepter protein
MIAVAGIGCVSQTHSEPASPLSLDPLVVSATRDVGTILSAGDLALFQIESVADLAGFVPGMGMVTSDTGGYGDILSMRGSANTLFFSPPAVGMMVDDVPMGEVSTYMTGLLEMRGIGVFRGPQGAAYGRNGAAGMLEMTTPAPASELEAGIAAEYGSYDSISARMHSTGPLGNGFFHTLQLYHQERDGYIRNTTLDRNTDNRVTDGGLANLYWRPDDSTELRLRVLAERSDDGSQRLSLLGSPDPFEVGSDVAGETWVERQQVSLHWTQQGAWGRLKSITAWQNWELDPGVTDLDLTANPGSYSTIRQDQRMWTQELRWESPEDSAPWSWRTGLFFMDQKSGGDTTRDYLAEVAPGYFMPFSERTLYQIDQWNAAAYGRIFYQANPRLSLQAGARLEYVGAEIDRTKTSNYALPGEVGGDLGDWYLSPEVGASYALADNTHLHVRSAVGVKPAGFSAFSKPSMAEYGEETGWTNEAGLTISVPDQRLDFSVNGFWSLIHDYQVNRPDIASTDYYTVNADRVTSFGMEAEAKWRPLDGLTVQGAAGWTHAEFDSYDDPLLPGVDYDGKRVPFIPEYTAALGVRYEFGGGFHAQTSIRFSGSTWFDENEDSDYHQGSYTTWDAEIGYTKREFTIAIFGRNLLDEDYYTFINPQIQAGSPGDPRVFGVRMEYGF